MNKQVKPTESELEILRVLWERGEATVREVHEELSKTKDAGYTTTLKLMQIMLDKELLWRDERQRTHVYEPRLTEEETQRQLVGDLLERAFGGSAEKLVMRALDAKRVSRKELAQIRKLLDELS